MMRKFALLWLFVCSVCRSAEVLRALTDGSAIAVSTDDNRPWELNERLCVARYEDRMCGSVVRTTPRVAMVAFNPPRPGIEKGESVVRAMRTNEYETTGPRELAWEVSAGAGATSAFGLLSAHAARRVSPEFSLGVDGLYTSSSVPDASFHAFGGLLSGTYYPSPPFGFSLQGSIGLTIFSIASASQWETLVSPVFRATAGYRFVVSGAYTIGIAAGLQWLRSPNSGILNLEFAATQPFGMIDFGILF